MKTETRKKIIPLLLLNIIIFAGTLLLSACKFPQQKQWYKDETYFETDLFRGHYLNGKMVLRALTELGIEQEELVIPSEIDGEPVNSIGYRLGEEQYFIKSKAKKVFLPGGIRVNPVTKMFNAEKYIFLSYQPDKNQFRPSALSGLRYVPSASYQSYLETWQTSENSNSINKANVSYMNNYDNELNGGYHWIDNLDNGEKVKTIPPVPIREGYTFGGWYTEPECVNLWNFDEGVMGDEEIILYAKWAEVI